MISFYYNGMKENDGKLQLCTYSSGPWVTLPADVITIRARKYDGFSKGVHEAFKVENDSDSQSDYFEKDHIRVFSNHPLYAQVKAAMEKCEAKYRKAA